MAAARAREADTGPRDDGRGRRPGGDAWAAWARRGPVGGLVLVLAVLAGVVFLLRGRRPALPAPTPTPSVSQAPAPAPATAPVPAATTDAAVTPGAPAPSPSPEPNPEPHPDPAPPARPDGAGLDELVRVSGLGRRSAEALVVAGIASLADLAEADDATLGAALDAAGVRRSATISSWPNQARRLLGA